MELPLGVYEHYKGKKYLVLGVAKHSETLEELVVYGALYENPESPLWVRPLTLFLEEVEVNGRHRPRFKLVRGSTSAEAQFTRNLEVEPLKNASGRN